MLLDDSQDTTVNDAELTTWIEECCETHNESLAARYDAKRLEATYFDTWKTRMRTKRLEDVADKYRKTVKALLCLVLVASLSSSCLSPLVAAVACLCYLEGGNPWGSEGRGHEDSRSGAGRQGFQDLETLCAAVTARVRENAAQEVLWEVALGDLDLS